MTRAVVESKPVKVYSDGKNMLIAMENTTFFMQDVLLNNISMSQEREVIDIGSPDLDGGYKQFMPSFHHSFIDLRLRLGGETIMSDKVNLSDFKFASSMTVRELFRVINKKLNKRKK